MTISFEPQASLPVKGFVYVGGVVHTRILGDRPTTSDLRRFLGRQAPFLTETPIQLRVTLRGLARTGNIQASGANYGF